MLPFLLLKYCWLVAITVKAQSSSSTSSSTSSSSTTASVTLSEATLPTGSYISYKSTLTLSSTTKTLHGSMTNSASSMAIGNSSISTTAAIPSTTQTVLSGTRVLTTSTTLNRTASSNSTTSSTSSLSPQATNTTPCNNFAEFCERKYSNITMVCAHNSPFIVPGNAASNQDLSVTTQLNDGIRMLQIQSHFVNDTMYLCHTSCDILNAGTLTSYLTTVNSWVQNHPYDVVTILIGNGDYVSVDKFVSPIQASGIDQYVYHPPQIPMGLNNWPTLASMILSSQRVVIFMDYQANQTAVPWILDEFSQMWETPFDPTDRSFPCTVQRPPNLTSQDARNMLYMVNHNLNQQVSLLGVSLLIPLKPLLPVTNNVSGYGSLGQSAENCYDDWGRAPNFLNVDYYNNGSGTVFQVAAKWNNVTWTEPCCGLVTSGVRGISEMLSGRIMIFAGLIGVMFIWS